MTNNVTTRTYKKIVPLYPITNRYVPRMLPAPVPNMFLPPMNYPANFPFPTFPVRIPQLIHRRPVRPVTCNIGTQTDISGSVVMSDPIYDGLTPQDIEASKIIFELSRMRLNEERSEKKKLTARSRGYPRKRRKVKDEESDDEYVPEKQEMDEECEIVLGKRKRYSRVPSLSPGENEFPRPKKKAQRSRKRPMMIVTPESKKLMLEKLASPSRRKRPKKRNSHMLPEKSKKILTGWFTENLDCPYPNGLEKTELMEATGLSKTQISNWFTNIRKRVWAPSIDETNGSGSYD